MSQFVPYEQLPYSRNHDGEILYKLNKQPKRMFMLQEMMGARLVNLVDTNIPAVQQMVLECTTGVRYSVQMGILNFERIVYSPDGLSTVNNVTSTFVPRDYLLHPHNRGKALVPPTSVKNVPAATGASTSSKDASAGTTGSSAPAIHSSDSTNVPKLALSKSTTVSSANVKTPSDSGILDPCKVQTPKQLANVVKTVGPSSTPDVRTLSKSHSSCGNGLTPQVQKVSPGGAKSVVAVTPKSVTSLKTVTDRVVKAVSEYSPIGTSSGLGMGSRASPVTSTKTLASAQTATQANTNAINTTPNKAVKAPAIVPTSGEHNQGMNTPIVGGVSQGSPSPRRPPNDRHLPQGLITPTFGGSPLDPVISPPSPRVLISTSAAKKATSVLELADRGGPTVAPLDLSPRPVPSVILVDKRTLVEPKAREANKTNCAESELKDIIAATNQGYPGPSRDPSPASSSESSDSSTEPSPVRKPTTRSETRRLSMGTALLAAQDTPKGPTTRASARTPAKATTAVKTPAKGSTPAARKAPSNPKSEGPKPRGRPPKATGPPKDATSKAATRKSNGPNRGKK